MKKFISKKMIVGTFNDLIPMFLGLFTGLIIIALVDKLSLKDLALRIILTLIVALLIFLAKIFISARHNK